MHTCGTVPSSSTSLEDDIKLALSGALREIFATMFGEEAVILPRHEEIADVPRISSIVGFGGTLSGLLCLHLSSAVACNVASGLLGMPVDAVDDTVRDAIGELSNMLAGGLKKHLSESDDMFKISIPSVIEGSEYSVHAPPESQQIWLGVAAGLSRFKIQLILEQK